MRLTIPTDSSDVELDGVDLLEPRLYGEGDPHRVWHAMREHDPVRWQAVGETGFWSVTRHADANRVLRDHAAFTSERGTMLSMLGVDDPAAGSEMTVTDPPRHTQMRVPLQRALSGKAMLRREERIRAEVRRLLAPALDGEPFDLAAMAMRLSATVACVLIGLPLEDRDLLSRLATTAIAPDDPEYLLPGGREATLAETHQQLFVYFHDAAQPRRGPAADDLLDVLFGIEVDGKPMDRASLAANCYSLLLGATVTTPHALGANVLRMMEDRSYHEWADHPELLQSGVEEALRWASPANHFMRYATQDVEVGGVRVREGEAVVAWLGSANRDAAVFPDPYRFDLRRQPNRHVAFGVGPHHCVGHSAARLTLRVAFEEVFRQFAGFEPAGPVDHLHSNFIAGIKHLPVVPHPRAERSRREPAAAGPAMAGCPFH
uniref:Cytochrome P450 hydroxylase n=1 Tax=uncultured bacterium AB_1383 TaxID=1630010 RepID=A0A0E3JNN9_9BACT|nr:cytochrome P450 hydroxylase [uncultured bacterium AB_1383]